MARAAALFDLADRIAAALAILVGLGFGDRRFIPTPSDIATRFWQLTVSGELAVNVLATLWRMVAGFVIGVVPAIAVGCSWRCSARCASSSIR